MKAAELKPYLDRGFTLALSDGARVITSEKRGVRPLVDIIDGGEDVEGFVAADKIVGRAAAMLYSLMGVRELYAEVISRSAAKECERLGIGVAYGVMTERIINRRGDGACPMERAVEGITDVREAYRAVKATIQSLSN